jgi:hypothetical protein
LHGRIFIENRPIYQPGEAEDRPPSP